MCPFSILCNWSSFDSTLVSLLMGRHEPGHHPSSATTQSPTYYGFSVDNRANPPTAGLYQENATFPFHFFLSFLFHPQVPWF